MGNSLYYFSGRGNSLSVAKALAQRMDTSAEAMATAPDEIRLSGGSLGLVLPVIDVGIPGIVHRFIKKLRVEGEAPYVYAVITCGGLPAASMLQLKHLLMKQGLLLQAGWFVIYGREVPADDQWNMLLDTVAATALGRQTLPLPKVSSVDRLLTGLNPLARVMIPSEDKKFRVSDACTGCGICARVCPVKNIELREGKPVWQHRCEQCAACFSWCPQAAISGSCLAAKTHYTNAKTRLEQMMLHGVKG